MTLLTKLTYCTYKCIFLSQITSICCDSTLLGSKTLGEILEGTTQDQTSQIYSDSIVRESFKSNLKTYLLHPIYIGIMGFAAFFSLILLTKLFGYFLGTNNEFNLQLNDVIYSLTGFVFAAGIKFFEFFGKEE